MTVTVPEPAAPARSRREPAPSPSALVFMLLAIGAPILLQLPMLNSDGDLARHLAHGRYMLDHGSVIRADPFSFTRAGAPFVGFEYGSQLVYALAERIGGLPGVAIVAGLLIALTYSLLNDFLLRRGVDPLLALGTVALSIALGAPYWSARPHLFSFVAVILLMRLLENGRRTLLLETAVLFVAWANLHGGFVYGWFLIGAYLVGSVGELLWGTEREYWRAQVQRYGGMLAVAIIATVVNPYGLALQRHLLEFFATPYLMENTAEFVSPNFHETGGKILLLVLLGSLSLLVLYRPRPTLPRLLLICAGAALALTALRNVPLFGLTALPVLALHTDALWRSLPERHGVRRRFEATARATSTLPWVFVVSMLLAALCLAHGRVGTFQLIQQGFDSTIFPVTAVAEARRYRLEGRLFSEFVWGGYVLYAWPEQRVFIDGGTDFYGEDLFREYTRIKRMSPGWRDDLAKRDISLLLLERDQPFTYEIARDASWSMWYCDSLAVVFRRSSSGSESAPARGDSVERALNGCARRSSHPLSHSNQ